MLARDVNGKVVGIEKKIGKGKVRFFGFYLQYSIEEHPTLWSAMMELGNVERNAWADNDDLHIEARFTKDEGILFLGNFHRMPMSAHVKVKDPRGGDTIDLGKVTINTLTGLFLPIQAKLSTTLALTYAYGELLERKSAKRGTTFVLRGTENSKGVIALNSRKAITSIKIDGKDIPFKKHGKLTVAKYAQNGDRQVVEVA